MLCGMIFVCAVKTLLCSLGGFNDSRGGDVGEGARYRGGGDMEIQHDTIFVSGMGQDCSEQMLIEHFGSIGVIKVCFLFGSVLLRF